AMLSVPLAELAQGRRGGPAGARRLFGGPGTGFGALFPEPADDGSLYFTRVTNGYYELARWNPATDPAARKIELLARGTGGYWLPSVGPGGKVAVSYVTSTGLRAAVLEPRKIDAVPPAVAEGIAHQPVHAPPPVSVSEPRGYNLLASLAPRIWVPYIALDQSQDQFGATLLGWDDLDQLEYSVFAWYDSISQKPEGIFSTFHRVETFKLGLAASSQVSAFALGRNATRAYEEERKLTASVTRPFPGAFASFAPTLLAEWARSYRDGDYGRHTFDAEQRLGAELVYDSLARYAYSILPEAGLHAELRGRRLFTGRAQAWKGLVNLNPTLPVIPLHSSLSLNAYFAVSPNPSLDIPVSQVRVGGAGTLSDLDPPLRGYPLGNFESQRAALVQTEYRVPVAQIFSGFGTWPVFLQNLGVLGFYDAAKFQRPTGEYGTLVSSAGAGLLLNATFGYAIPIQLRLEFAHGFRRNLNGEDSLAFFVKM
ncbi:MAG: hypothetical protein HY075_12100, partial [Deltaproteobacteria bacterium]|nr:hypothetical protein [Deltaproteobacteria bacterium]